MACTRKVSMWSLAAVGVLGLAVFALSGGAADPGVTGGVCGSRVSSPAGCPLAEKAGLAAATDPAVAPAAAPGMCKACATSGGMCAMCKAKAAGSTCKACATSGGMCAMCKAKATGGTCGMKCAARTQGLAHVKKAIESARAAVEKGDKATALTHLDKAHKMVTTMHQRMAATATPAPTFVNARCPMMGSKIDPAKVPESLTREHKGRKVAFCCGGCPGAWDKLTNDQKQEKLDKVLIGK